MCGGVYSHLGRDNKAREHKAQVAFIQDLLECAADNRRVVRGCQHNLCCCLRCLYFIKAGWASDGRSLLLRSVCGMSCNDRSAGDNRNSSGIDLQKEAEKRVQGLFRGTADAGCGSLGGNSRGYNLGSSVIFLEGAFECFQ